MNISPLRCFTFVVFFLSVQPFVTADGEVEDGFTPLFNRVDLSGWIVPEGDGDHWKVLDGVIDYDSRSEAQEDKNLCTEEDEFGDP